MTKPAPPSASPLPPSWTTRPALAALLIFAAVLLAWANSFTAPFVFDDHGSIVDNASIRHVWPPAWWHPPATAGETVSGRPVLNLSFALDYAAGGLDVRGYHAGNFFIHVLAGLTLWCLLRRVPGVGGAGVALAVALIWAVHPLQTAAVTYVVQRAESLAGLFNLLALYGFVRGTEEAGWSPTSGRAEGEREQPARRSGSTKGWFVLAVVSCLLGVGAKETVAVVPVIVLLYDRAFVAGSFRAAWSARGRVHAALFATWIPLAVLVAGNHARGGTAGPGAIGAWAYFLTQCGAIVRYLGLVFWPVGQVFDYGVATAPGFAAVAPQFLLLATLAAATLWALGRNRPMGFAGACFFLLLAPSSSFVPVVTQTVAEHRMYLALAVPVLLVVMAVASRLPRPAAGLALAAGTVVALGAATFVRNTSFRSPQALWSDTVAKRPANPRAHYNLGLALQAAGRTREAVIEFERTVALQPNHALAYFELGKGALLARQWPEAAGYFQAALAADPHFVDARVNFAESLAGLDRTDDAIAQYRAALADDPEAADIRTNLAGLLVQQDQLAEGEAMLREVIAKVPDLAEAHYHLGFALAKSGAVDAAEAEFRAAVRLKPAFPAAQRALGNALAARGDAPGAEAAYREALRLDDDDSGETWYALGNLEAKQQRFAEAMAAYRATLERDPDHVPARNNLANCQLVTGQFDDAIASYEAVLRARPGDATVQRNLDLARELKRTGGGNH